MAVVARFLARWYLSLVQWLVTFLHWAGLLRLDEGGDANGAAAAGEGHHRSARQVVRDAVRATARAAEQLIIHHHPGLAPEVVAAVERACTQAAEVGVLGWLAARAGACKSCTERGCSRVPVLLL